MLGDSDGEAGITDLEDVAVIALDGPGVGVLENSRIFFCSRRCFARSARTPFLIGDAKRFPSVETGESSIWKMSRTNATVRCDRVLSQSKNT